jgi:hypothetical protein
MKKPKSVGKCHLCEQTVARASMLEHLSTCGQPGDAKGQPLEPCFHLTVEGCGKTYWLHLSAPVSMPLNKLDEFLRGIWLECCGHMSAFEIGGIRYASTSFGGGERSMKAPLGQVAGVGTKFFYEYDFGSTTELALKVIGLREEEALKGGVRLLARNAPPNILCGQCGEQLATIICTECSWDGGGEFCEGCAAVHECDDEMYLPLVNSPRAGVCAYAG